MAAVEGHPLVVHHPYQSGYRYMLWISCTAAQARHTQAAHVANVPKLAHLCAKRARPAVTGLRNQAERDAKGPALRRRHMRPQAWRPRGRGRESEKAPTAAHGLIARIGFGCGKQRRCSRSKLGRRLCEVEFAHSEASSGADTAPRVARARSAIAIPNAAVTWPSGLMAGQTHVPVGS